MNRCVTLVTLLLMNGLIALAQNPGTKTKTDNQSNIADTTETAIENKLVELALKGPSYEASKHQYRINELDLKRAKNSWLNLLTISTNYNDQSFAKQTPSTPATTYVYPKYFFGVTIPLGVIFSQGTQVKTAKESIAYTKAQQDQLARTIKADVLSKYKQYKLYGELIEIQSELINDVIANASQAENNFKNGSITVEAYITALKIKNDELAKNLNLKLQQDLVQIEIEKLIGVPLQEVLHPTPAPANK